MTLRVTEVAGLRTVIVEPPDSINSVVVVLHGYAMRPEDLSPFGASMRSGAAFLFPQGPVAADPSGFAWWPIDQERKAQQLQCGPRDLYQEYPVSRPEARATLKSLIDATKQSFAGMPLILVGFSQGGMLCCDAFLHAKLDIAGMALLSSSRIAIHDWTPRLPALVGLPVLVSHGRADPDLSFCAGNSLRHLMEKAGASVTWVPFEGGHEIPLLVWRELRRFIARLSKGT